MNTICIDFVQFRYCARCVGGVHDEFQFGRFAWNSVISSLFIRLRVGGGSGEKTRLTKSGNVRFLIVLPPKRAARGSRLDRSENHPRVIQGYRTSGSIRDYLSFERFVPTNFERNAFSKVRPSHLYIIHNLPDNVTYAQYTTADTIIPDCRLFSSSFY